MRTVRSILYAALLSSSFATLAPAAEVPGYIKAAVADVSRPERDTVRDVNRKPAEVLTFAGVKPGDKVGELLPGGGYFTRLFCKVVGEQGHVYAMKLKLMMAFDRPPPPPAPPAPGTPCANVSEDTQPAAELVLPTGLDMVWTSENYHDLYNKLFGSPDMKKLNQAVFVALKPGGVYMVEDHVAAAGSGAQDTDTLHRIDPEQVKRDVTSVGFVFEAASEVLHNPDDPHTAKAHAMEGKSDKFLFKFRKPAH